MELTYKDLEQLTGMAYHRIAQLKSRGYIDNDGDGAATKGDPATFTNEMVYRVLWLAQMQAHGFTIERALTLWEEHCLNQHELLLVTEEGATWVSPTLYQKKMKSLFADHNAFFAVSMRHFYEMAKSRLTAFERVKKMRNKIGIPTVERTIAAVH